MKIAIPPHDLALFVGKRRELHRALQVLAAAESLTDDLALLMLGALDVRLNPGGLLKALHLCDFVIERNSEWQLSTEAREYLLSELAEHRELQHSSHRLLLRVATEQLELEETPAYLQSPLGLAYHSAFFDRERALREYSRIGLAPKSGDQWLAAQLALEQVNAGILPSATSTIDFLVGIVFYRDGRPQDAEPYLRRVADSDESTLEVAIAAHLIGLIDGRTPSKRKRAETYLRRSLNLRDELKDVEGEAHVRHTLGRLLSLDPKRRDEAESLINKSIELLTILGDQHGLAQARHSLGTLLKELPGRLTDAEDQLEQARLLLEDTDDLHGYAEVLHSLGNVVARDAGRRGDAEALLEESYNRLVVLNDVLGQAQVLRSLALVVRHRDRSQAISLLNQSLALNLSVANERGAELVRRSLRGLGASNGPDASGAEGP